MTLKNIVVIFLYIIMINLHKRMMPDIAEFEPATPSSVRHTSD